MSKYNSLDESLLDGASDAGLAPSASFALHEFGGQGGRVFQQDVDSTQRFEETQAAKAGKKPPKHLSREEVIRSARHFKKLKPISDSRIRWYNFTRAHHEHAARKCGTGKGKCACAMRLGSKHMRMLAANHRRTESDWRWLCLFRFPRSSLAGTSCGCS